VHAQYETNIREEYHAFLLSYDKGMVQPAPLYYPSTSTQREKKTEREERQCFVRGQVFSIRE
jgi:hypothetical protein